MGVLKPDPVSHELTLVAVYPGVEVDGVRRATGWDLRVADVVEVGNAPTREELAVLRDLEERTRQAHSG